MIDTSSSARVTPVPPPAERGVKMARLPAVLTRRRTRMGLEQRARILVVDDEKAVRGLIERVLSDAGYEVVGLASGLAGLEAALTADRPYHLLVTNNNMPGMSGSDLVARVRSAHPELPILHLDDQSDEAPRQLPPDVPSLTKPFSIEKLLGCVRQLLPDGGPHSTGR
jgi:DNA-binding response OmpR family regulator